jgi:formamidopyrimidine-DNA glycosylase
MPELPEVEAFKKYIQKHAMKKKIAEVHISDASVIKGVSASTFKKDLVKESFSKVERRGKYVIIHLSHLKKLLIMHFGMSGFLYYSKDAEEKVRFSRVAFIFTDHAVLHWLDIRKFGKVWLVDSIDKIKGLSQLGPEALKITKKQFEELSRILKRS